MHEDYLPLLSSYQKMESSILSVAHSIYRLPELSHIWEGKSMATMMDNNHRLTMHYPAFEALDNLVGSLRYLKWIDEVDQLIEQIFCTEGTFVCIVIAVVIIQLS